MDLNPYGQLPLLPRCFFLMSGFSLAGLDGLRILFELFSERNVVYVGGRRGLSCISSWSGGEELGGGDEIRMRRCGVSAVIELVALRAERTGCSPALA